MPQLGVLLNDSSKGIEAILHGHKVDRRGGRVGASLRVEVAHEDKKRGGLIHIIIACEEGVEGIEDLLSVEKDVREHDDSIAASFQLLKDKASLVLSIDLWATKEVEPLKAFYRGDG